MVSALLLLLPLPLERFPTLPRVTLWNTMSRDQRSRLINVHIHSALGANRDGYGPLRVLL